MKRNRVSEKVFKDKSIKNTFATEWKHCIGPRFMLKLVYSESRVLPFRCNQRERKYFVFWDEIAIKINYWRITASCVKWKGGR